MKLISKILAATALAGMATAVLAQTPAPQQNTKQGPSANLSTGPYFTVGPQYPADPNAPPAAGRGGAAGRGQATAAAGGRGPAPAAGGAPAAAGRGPAGAAPAPGRGGAPSFGTEDNAPLLWEEHWNRGPLAQPMTQASLGNQQLRLHLYGDVAGIRKSTHATEDYTYTGEARNNWAIMVSDPTSYWDLRVPAKMLLRTRNTGFRQAHIIIKTSDGRYYASEEGSGESSAWMNRDYILGDLHWRNLAMTDTPSNAASAVRPADPNRAVLVPTSVATPDLSKVEEIGFSDLMPGGFIPATLRINAFALFGKKVPR